MLTGLQGRGQRVKGNTHHEVTEGQVTEGQVTEGQVTEGQVTLTMR